MSGRGTVWYRLVGLDLAEMSNTTAGIEASVRGVVQPHNLVPVFGSFVQVDVSNFTDDSGAVALTKLRNQARSLSNGAPNTGAWKAHQPRAMTSCCHRVRMPLPAKTCVLCACLTGSGRRKLLQPTQSPDRS